MLVLATGNGLGPRETRNAKILDLTGATAPKWYPLASIPLRNRIGLGGISQSGPRDRNASVQCAFRCLWPIPCVPWMTSCVPLGTDWALQRLQTRKVSGLTGVLAPKWSPSGAHPLCSRSSTLDVLPEPPQGRGMYIAYVSSHFFFDPSRPANCYTFFVCAHDLSGTPIVDK